MTDATDLPFYPPDTAPRPPRPVVAHPTLHGSGVVRREGMQGQDFVIVLDGRPGGNAAGSPLCQLAVLMDPGKVSTPHVHDETDVYVRLEECGPQGVLTFYGDQLEHEEWMFEGGSLWLPAGVPHVAVYPRFHDAPTAVGIETRTTPDPFADVRALPELWPTLVRVLGATGLLGQVDAPVEAGDAWTVG
jgi:uncharacterized RmlC-like cupin family protein